MKLKNFHSENHSYIELENKMWELDIMYFNIFKKVFGKNQELSSYPQWIKDDSQMFKKCLLEECKNEKKIYYDLNSL